jgi:hypothetical protein
MQGDIHFRIFSHILKSLKEKPGLYNTYMTFMGWTLDAHLACARLSLVKLFDRTKEATSIAKLHRYAKTSLSAEVQGISYPLLERAISIGEPLLEQLGDLQKVLSEQRNKHFVHLSREFLGDYSKVYDEFQITLGDFTRLYATAITILEEYQYALPGSSGSLAVLGIERDVEDSLNKMARSAKGKDAPDQLYYARFKVSDIK